LHDHSSDIESASSLLSDFLTIILTTGCGCVLKYFIVCIKKSRSQFLSITLQVFVGCVESFIASGRACTGEWRRPVMAGWWGRTADCSAC